MSKRSPSLRGRVFRAVAIVAAMLLALCALSTVAVTRLGGAIGLILRENYVSVIACQEMTEALERQDSAALFAISGRKDLASPLLELHRARFESALEREAGNVTLPGEAQLIEEVRASYRDYQRSVESVLQRPDGSRITGYFEELLPRFDAVRSRVTAIRLMNQENMESADRRGRGIAQRTLQLAILVTAGALAFSAWFAWRLPKTIVGPVEAFAAHARSIGEGKLDRNAPTPDIAELNALGDALNRMQEKLRAYRQSSLGELLAAKDLSRATISSMIDPVIVFDARGEVVLVNDATENTFRIGPNHSDVLRRGGGDVPEPIAVVRDAVLAKGLPVLPQSLSDAMRWITDGGESYFLVRASPLRGEESLASGVIVVAQDVTRFRRIDALKSDVVATVSHELKTPLTSLRLATHMLLEESTGPLRDVQRELATTARDETERLQGTVNELLDLVRIERDAGQPKLSLVNASALLKEVAVAHRTLAEQKHVEIAFDAEAPETTVELDPEQVTIVLSNLVSNAIRHSSEGERVVLGSRNEGRDHLFSVEDHGQGIAPADLERIFERHWTGAEPSTLKGRHGLGLAIAKEIAERHGGTLQVRTEIGKGSTFLLRIPQSRPESMTRS